jgi:hypothetical protein
MQAVIQKFETSNLFLIKYVLTTPNTPLIHTSFTYSKLNMDDFSVLAGPLEYVDSTQEVEWNSFYAQKSFITEFAILCKNPPFYEVKKIFQKRLCAWGDFKNIFSRPLFIINFRPKISILGTYSILST